MHVSSLHLHFNNFTFCDTPIIHKQPQIKQPILQQQSFLKYTLLITRFPKMFMEHKKDLLLEDIALNKVSFVSLSIYIYIYIYICIKRLGNHILTVSFTITQKPKLFNGLKFHIIGYSSLLTKGIVKI